MMPQTSNKKKIFSRNDSLLEALRDLGGGIGKSVGSDVVGKVGEDVFASLLGTRPKSQGELRPEEAYDFNPEQMARPQARRVEFVRPQPIKLEEAGLKQKIESVRLELAKLTESMKSLNTEIDKAVNEIPVQPGIYHLNFLERLRSVIILMRQNIDDSRTWLSFSTNRKKKQGYWGMYKKHGTNFGLSNERTLATQAG
jgi:hypothetical protein